MNLHSIASRTVAVVNPMRSAQVLKSVGYTTASDGSQVPDYQTFDATAQIQSASGGDLRQADGLNLQGDKIVAYLNGDWRGVIRQSGVGGDLFVVPDEPWAGTWVVQMVMETWPDWSKVLLTLQNRS